MKFIQRVGYYLGGFSIGLIILAFFLQGKKTSCDYGPNARTTKNIADKNKLYSDEVKRIMNIYEIDTLTISNLVRFGDVDFSKSNTKLEDCKTYHINNTFKEHKVELFVKNCDSMVIIENITVKK